MPGIIRNGNQYSDGSDNLQGNPAQVPQNYPPTGVPPRAYNPQAPADYQPAQPIFNNSADHTQVGVQAGKPEQLNPYWGVGETGAAATSTWLNQRAMNAPNYPSANRIIQGTPVNIPLQTMQQPRRLRELILGKAKRLDLLAVRFEERAGLMAAGVEYGSGGMTQPRQRSLLNVDDWQR
jgi:hypothetical protein